MIQPTFKKQLFCLLIAMQSMVQGDGNNTVTLAFTGLVCSIFTGIATNPQAALSLTRKIGKMAHEGFYLMRFGRTYEAQNEHVAKNEMLERIEAERRRGEESLLQYQRDALQREEVLKQDATQMINQVHERALLQGDLAIENARLEEKLRASNALHLEFEKNMQEAKQQVALLTNQMTVYRKGCEVYRALLGEVGTFLKVIETGLPEPQRALSKNFIDRIDSLRTLMPEFVEMNTVPIGGPGRRALGWSTNIRQLS